MKTFWLWSLAVILTVAAALYQRVTGPTYELKGTVAVAGAEIKYELPRSCDSTEDCPIAIQAPAGVEGYLEYRRFRTQEPLVRIPLVRRDGELVGALPRQQAAVKLAYTVTLASGDETVPLAGGETVVARFKDPVPTGVLIPHIIIMFAGMLASTAAGLTALDRKRNPRRMALWAVGLLFVGGFIMGPLVQKFAFGAYWTGFPLGADLTDTKTLISFLFWVGAVIAGRKGRPARGAVIAASVVTLVIFLIPHSLFGSELKPGQTG
jgi:hypothetical protein